MADYLSPHLQQQYGIHPQKECFYGSCGTQRHMPGTQEESYLHIVQSIISWSQLWTLGGLWTNCSPFQTQSRSHGKHCLRKSPTDKRIFMDVQVWCEVPKHHWRKKIQIWMHWKEQLVKTREGMVFQMQKKTAIKTSKGTWKISETWYHQRITIIL